jgi:hypothetical protein
MSMKPTNAVGKPVNDARVSASSSSAVRKVSGIQPSNIPRRTYRVPSQMSRPNSASWTSRPTIPTSATVAR